MASNIPRRAVLVGISACIALSAQAQTPPASRTDPAGGEFAVLERPVALDVASSSGSLKETAQQGQELIWHRKDQSSDRRFQLSNISVAFLPKRNRWPGQDDVLR